METTNTTTARKNDGARVWQVTRFCCTSGQCFECRQRGHGRERIVHADRLTKKMADTMARNWASYDAMVSRMPEAQ